ncbi:hypothetical protein LINGRAHAP2_LOCUS24381 [Linum grandiflorum]
MWSSLNPLRSYHFPRGRSRLGQIRPQGRPDTRRLHRPVPHPAEGSRSASQFVHKGAAIFAGENVFEGELQMSSGADGASR